MIYPSASRMGRAVACKASWLLPQDYGTGGDAATLGTAVHQFLEDVNKEGRKAALKKVPDFARAFCEALDTDELPLDRQQYTAELRVAWWPDSGKAEVVPREERFIEGAVTAMMDVTGLMPDAVYIEDYKTGYTYLGDPKDNWQLRTGALLAARAFGKHKALVAIRWLRSDGSTWVDKAEFDAMDLDDIEDELRNLCVALGDYHATGEIPPCVTGTHCRFCNAYRACPAKVSLINAVVQAPEATSISIQAQLTEANAPEAYARWREIKDLVDKVGTAIHAFAAEAPIDVGNGQELRLAETKREYLDGEVVFEVLREMHGDEIADQAIKRTVTKTSLQDALRRKASGKDVTLKGVVEATMSEIRAKGGANTKVSESVRLVKKKAQR